MSAQLRDIAGELAALLWREHTLYRERSGTVVIRGAHVERWISLSPTGGQDQVLVRAGRILDGGTTAPARSEAVATLTEGTSELAAVCRRLLADTAAGPAPMSERPRRGRPKKAKAAKRSPKPVRRSRHTGFVSWMIILAVIGVVALFVRNLATAF
ncbi:hypothetical protein [Streptomyces sp. WM6378]|uniref:hypothetical protein n=1 Tax=Streptomyces sp. WM6378 TaxID=1415557 RepID=UPI000AAF81A8|nr:hypothetical protein [Streptomyces sp. WM6378]